MQVRDEDALVARYIEQLTALESGDRAGRLGPDDLAAIARELGADDALLERARQSADAHFAATVRLLGEGKVGEAEVQLRVARDLAPFDPRVEALEGRIARARRKRLMPALIGFAVAFGITIAIFAASAGRESTPPRPHSKPPVQQPVPTPTPPETTPPPANPTQAPVATPPTRRPNRNHHEVPAELVVESQTLEKAGASLTLRQPDIEHRVYGASATKGFLHAAFELGYQAEPGAAVLERATGRIELLAEDGAVLTSQPFDLLRHYDAPMRPGEFRPVGSTSRAPPSPIATRARIVVELVRLGKPAAAVPQAAPQPLTWRGQQPTGVDVAFEERAFVVRRSGQRHFVSLELDAVQRGEQPIGLLRLEIRFFDASGELVDVQSPYVTTSSQPPLLPGTRRLVRRVGLLDRVPTRYELAVLQVSVP